MQNKQTDESDNEVFGGSGRRARLEDLQRLEAKLAEAMGFIRALEAREAEREAAPLSPSKFMAIAFLFAVFAGKRGSNLRIVAEEALGEYNDYLAGLPPRPLGVTRDDMKRAQQEAAKEQASKAAQSEPTMVPMAGLPPAAIIEGKVEAATA